MTVKTNTLGLVGGLSLLMAGAAWAEEPVDFYSYKITKTWDDVDPKIQAATRVNSFGCYAGCHRPSLEGVTDTVLPLLEGYDAQYMFDQWVDTDNRRKSGMSSEMKLFVYNNTIEEMEAIALYFAGQDRKWDPKPEVVASDSYARGQAIYDKDCKICHGDQGASEDPRYPHIKGQMPAYLFGQMVAYADYSRNTRDAAKMVPFARMYDEDDYKDIVAYLSGMFYKEAPKGEYITGIGMPAPKGFKMPDSGQIQNFTDDFGEDSDYIKNPLSYTVSESGLTTLDNNTQLMWERDSSRFWVDPVEARDYCEALELDGYTDWRVPLVKEAASIADLGDFRPAADTEAFLNMPRGSSGIWIFPVSDHPDHAWHVGFPDGHTMGQHSASTKLVRCVRADGGAAYHNNDFADNGDGTVSDRLTGLLWQQNIDYVRRNWDDALNHCQNLDYAGRTDWRSPNLKELMSIVNYNKQAPSIDETFFPNTPAELFFWSNSTHVAGPVHGFRPLLDRKKDQSEELMDRRGVHDSQKWMVDFQLGGAYGAIREFQAWTRCVTYDD